MLYTFRCAMRNSLFSAAFSALTSLAFSLAFSEAWAQGLPPDDGGFEIETETQQDSGFDWNQYIGGSVGTVSANGDTASRQLTALTFDINLPATDKLRTVLSIDAVDFENSYTQELKERYQDDHRNCRSVSPSAMVLEHPGPTPSPPSPYTPSDRNNPTPQEIQIIAEREAQYSELVGAHVLELERYGTWSDNNCQDLINDAGNGYIPLEQETDVSDSFADFREAYVQWEPTDYATLAVGRQNLVWGQFDFLSPVGFLLPFRTTNTSTRPSRADFAFGQDAVNLSLFPTSNSEVQLIHVPQMRVEPSVEENSKSYAKSDYCTRDDNGGFIGCSLDIDRYFPDAADYDMSALRFTHYGERLTFAVTALDGTQVSFDPYRDATLVRDGANGIDCGTFEDDDGGQDDASYCWRNERGLAYSELETLALEFSYILNPRVTIKGEFVAYESIDGIDIRDPSSLDNNLSDPTGSGTEDRLAHAIVRHNQGRPYIINDEIFLALGFDYEGDKWFGHLQLLAIDTQPSSQVDEVLECIDDDGEYDGTLACRPSDNPFLRGNADDDSSEVAPVFFIGRRLGDEDEGFVGGGATALFNAYGAGFFGGWRFNENFELGGFLGSVVDVTDSGPQDSQYYDTIDDGDTLAQIGITYLF